jgi:hypothetical protein
MLILGKLSLALELELGLELESKSELALGLRLGLRLELRLGLELSLSRSPKELTNTFYGCISAGRTARHFGLNNKKARANDHCICPDLRKSILYIQEFTSGS